MAGIPEYIEQFGNRSFDEVPFGDADNYALCQIFYLPFERVVSASFDDPPVSFADAADRLFAARGLQHKRIGVLLTKAASVNTMKMAKQPRFAQMKLTGVRSAFRPKPALQYGFGTFLLPDGTAVVIFRGTDDTVIGWKEDLDLYLNGGMATYPHAAAYLAEVAEKFDGGIILCGHSKGGNVALYAALTAEKPVRDRIIGVYNNDGPGFKAYSIYQTGAYEELLPRYHHLVPHASMFGMFLAHDYDYTAVESMHRLGPFQHDLSFWKIENGASVTRSDINQLGKFNDVVLSNLIFRLRDDQLEILEYIANQLLDGANVDSLTQAIRWLPRVALNVLRAWLNTDKEKQTEFRRATHGVTHTFLTTAKTFSKGDIPTLARAAGMTQRAASDAAAPDAQA